jgi:hypothetical protein
MTVPTDEHLIAYALELLKTPGHELPAAMRAVGRELDDPDKADAYDLVVWARENPTEFTVYQKAASNSVGKDHYIPTKEIVALEILTIARNVANESDLRLRAYRLFNEMVGYSEKAQTAAVSVNVVNNRVMVVPAFTSREEWEVNAEAQQQKLIEDAAQAAKPIN